MVKSNRSTHAPDDEILVSIRATPIRRICAMVLLVFFTAVLLQIGLELPMETRPWVKIIALSLSVLSGLQAGMMWRATGRAIELTRTELRESGPEGRVLARVAEIDSVDTSAIAFRPATGFLMTLKASAPLAFAPGMWWRRGRKLAVGGVTARSHGKMLSSALKDLLAERHA